MITNKKINKIDCIILIIVALTAYLLIVFPPSGDDFNRLAMNSLSFLEKIGEVKKSYINLNGRLVGNAMSFFLINKPISILVKLVFIFGIVYLISRITSTNLCTFIFIIGGIFFLDINIFREVIVWNSGFFNYVPPVFLILLIINIYINYNKNNFYIYILLGTLSLTLCLFMENISIYMFFLPLLLGFFKPSNLGKRLVIFLGSFLGNILMFSSPVYKSIAGNNDGYRTLYTDQLIKIVEKNWEVFRKNLILGNKILFCLLIIILVQNLYKEINNKRYFLIVSYIIGIVSGLGILLCPKENYWIINIGLHIIFYTTLIAGSTIFSYKSKSIVLFSIFSIALSMGPLLFVNPVGPRNFFTPLIFNLLIFISYLNELKEKINPVIIGFVCLLVISRQISYCYIYTNNYKFYESILSVVYRSIESEEKAIVVGQYPYPDYVHELNFDKLILSIYAQEGLEFNKKIIIEEGDK